ncbi:MAG: endo-1,4-beta-xylanase [Fibrobacter sp.]|nr:endo-1,4-beta-xylanase [Fibrobacter sp.]
MFTILCGVWTHIFLSCGAVGAKTIAPKTISIRICQVYRSILSILAIAAVSFSFAGPGLADGAAKFVGNITTNGQVRSDFGTYWNQITAEKECTWASIESSRGRYNWSGCDAAFNWAKNNGGHFKFHALVWGSQYPNWLNGLSAAETKKAITAWMDAVKQHYPELEMIDVVNEAIKSGGKYHSNYGSQGNNNIIAALGGDNGNYEFVVTAFNMARERWPKAILIYNDYNTIQSHKNEGIDLIQKLKKNGAPVDAYGLQGRDLMTSDNCISINTIKLAIDEIWNKTQTPIFISQYKIDTDNDNIQEQCYEEQISYFMENEHVAGITIWGYIYGSTTTNGDSDNAGLIKDSKDRPAMTWLKRYLSENKGVNTTELPTGVVVPVEPELQTPFKGEPFAIPGKIEVEDFDIPGKGVNEDGTSNASYGDDSENHGDSDYRVDTGADLYQKATGIVLGFNETGDWYEYTVNVANEGKYTVIASVATEGTAAFTLSIGGDVVGEFTVIGESYDDFFDVKQEMILPAGQHVLRLDVTQEYFEIDYIDFKAEESSSSSAEVNSNTSSASDESSSSSATIVSSSASDKQPNVDVQSSSSAVPAVVWNNHLHIGGADFASYDVYDLKGQKLVRFVAHNMEEVTQMWNNWSANASKVQGIVLIRNRLSGETVQIRSVR